MRTSTTLLLGCAVLLALAAPALASDEDRETVMAQYLEAVDSKGPVDGTWEAYVAARKVLDEYKKANPGKDDPLKDSFDGSAREAARQLEPKAAEALEALEKIAADESAAWKDKWSAYKAAKDALEKAEGERPEIAEKKGPASDWYGLIQGQVAEAVRRDELSITGWLMGLFGAVLLWGGFAFCVHIARKAGPPPEEG